MGRLVVLVAVAVAVVLAPARALAAEFPGERSASGPAFAAMLDLAGEFWAARGVPATCVPTEIVLADSLRAADGEALGRGDEVRCRIYLTASFADRAVAAIDDRRMLLGRRMAAEQLCTAIVHEEGHVRGLGHTADGIMGPTAVGSVVPWDCARLARRLVRRPAEGQALARRMRLI